MGAGVWEGLGEEGPYTHIRTVEYCELNIKMSSIFLTQIPKWGENPTLSGDVLPAGPDPVPDPSPNAAE